MLMVWKKARARIGRMLSIAIGACLGALCGFGGCEYGPAPAYGMPRADFTVRGTVRAQRDNAAIPGIALSLLDTLTSYGISDTVTSDAAGRYIIAASGNPNRNTWVLRAWDRDGPENGDFLPADTVIAIAREQLSGGDGCWYAGAAEREIDVRLARKQ